MMIDEEVIAAPFIKWAGGKSQILNEIRIRYPNGLGDTITKYAEPFIGGGAILFDILNRFTMSEIYISDMNRELIHTYISIRDNVDELIKKLLVLEKDYLFSDNKEIREKIYYDNRKRFNHLKMEQSEELELAALFIFLNKTCFNGLYRVNSTGMFNVPIGSYKNPSIYNDDSLYAVSHKLKNVRIICGDYTLSNDFIDENTFVYFDPPYRPLTKTANFNSYTHSIFDDNAQKELANFIIALSNKGAYVLLSNSDPKNVDHDDDFFDNLYRDFNIDTISASRMINSVGNKRGKINELLIMNYINEN